MKIHITLILCCLLAKVHSQDFSELVFDNDTIGVQYIDCSSIFGWHMLEVDSKNDSLYCLIISIYPLENSNKALVVNRNFYGDTLGIGLNIEIKEKVRFGLLKKPLFRKTYLVYHKKIGEWLYYDQNGKLVKKENY